MTNEEFEGHLMACLHGPNAVTIVARIVEVGLTDPDTASSLGDLLASFGDDLTGDLCTSVWKLQAIVLADERADDMRTMISRASLKVGMVDDIKRSLRSMLARQSSIDTEVASTVIRVLGLGSEATP